MIGRAKNAFTLVELLVVIAVIAMLLAILSPTLVAARSQARAIICRSNLHQLLLANIGYATENNGSFVAAASDIYDMTSGNKHRWHGVRDDLNSPFDPKRSPLAAYLADGTVKKCPTKVKFRKGLPWDYNFEDGCGGYGYNMEYIGSRIWESGFSKAACENTTKDTEVRSPSRTVMFADAALPRLDKSSNQTYLQEYSFVKPTYILGLHGKPMVGAYFSPSIHFRHRGKANIGWADGHADSRTMAAFEKKNVYGVKSCDMMVGWFEPLDNTLFDLK